MEFDFTRGNYIAKPRRPEDGELGRIHRNGAILDKGGVLIYQILDEDVYDANKQLIGRIEAGMALTNHGQRCIFTIEKSDALTVE